MTSTSVKGVNLYTLNQTGMAGTAREKTDAFSDCFTQICSRSQDGKRPVEDYTAKTEPKAAKTEGNVHKSLSKKDVSKSEDLPAEESLEDDITEKVNEAAEKLIAEIAAQLGMSVEEVIAAMEQMDMCPEDLLCTDNITELMVQLSGGGDETCLLTDETLYQSVKEVSNACENLMQELAEQTGMSTQELSEWIEKMAQESKEAGEIPEMQNVAVVPVTEVVKPAAENRMPILEIRETDSGVQNTDYTPVQESQPVKPENETKSQTETEDHDQKNESKDGYLQQMNGQDNKVNLETMVQETGAAAGDADTEQIIKQIVDYMKVQVKADMTQMEIQLHPASLGNVHVQITAKNGAITAQFTAQNEAVKTALESQMVQLKEALNEQGVKVEAVEVTIASHEFERNLEQNQSGGQQNAPREKKGSRRMQLNLTGVEEPLTEDMDEAERIAADMMTRNGNTVDFSA